MKTIYLKDENYGWKAYEYNELSYLAAELKDRNISIGYGSILIGDHASIGYGVSIGDHVSIRYGAIIGGGVSIGDRTSIGCGAIIGDRTSIGCGAIIGDRTSIGDHVSIGGRVIIGCGAIIGDRVIIGYDAIIGDRVKLLTGIYFNGSKYPVTYVGDNKVSIGCECYYLDDWKSDGLDIAKNEGFTMSEIQEYIDYIDLIELFIKK